MPSSLFLGLPARTRIQRIQSQHSQGQQRKYLANANVHHSSNSKLNHKLFLYVKKPEQLHTAAPTPRPPCYGRRCVPFESHCKEPPLNLPNECAYETHYFQNQHSSSACLHYNAQVTPAGVVQWTERGSIPSQGTHLGCEPGPQLGVCERQPIYVFLTHRCLSPSLSSLPSPSLKINKYKWPKSYNQNQEVF